MRTAHLPLLSSPCGSQNPGAERRSREKEQDGGLGWLPFARGRTGKGAGRGGAEGQADHRTSGPELSPSVEAP